MSEHVKIPRKMNLWAYAGGCIRLVILEVVYKNVSGVATKGIERAIFRYCLEVE